MKKFIAMIVAAAMILSLAAIPALAENEGAPAFTVTEATAKPGEEVTVDLKLSGNYEAHGLNMKINYDPAQLTATKYVIGDLGMAAMQLGCQIIVNVEKLAPQGKVAVGAMAPEEPITGDGTLCTITFKVAETVEAGAELPLEISVEEFFNHPVGGEKTDIEGYVMNNGKITVAGEDPTTEPPVTDAPVTDAPVTDAPETDAPETENPTENPGTTPGTPSTGAISLIGLGVVAAITGSGVVLFRKKED